MHAHSDARLLGTAPLITPLLWGEQRGASSYRENRIFLLVIIIILFLILLGMCGGGESGGLMSATTQSAGDSASVTCSQRYVAPQARHQ